ncbi:MAG: DegT/DnrJ/EryC1/StrS family aminotransferase, partial [Nitrospinota bacterium]|nr:DegT/DnrJ/EryC1/StrS family aminotransferase [Nitrospinota bacterium]
MVDGLQTRAFEQAVAGQTGTAWGIAVTSGTTALHLALLGLGVGAGDRVVLPSFVCVALLHAIRYVGAEPIVVDVDPETMNLDPDALKHTAPAGLKAVIVPHMFGLPAPVDAILSLGIPVIEDCALAIGATDHGRPVGGQGSLGICSFYATKMLATGEGGMVVGQDSALEARIQDLRDYDQPDGK